MGSAYVPQAGDFVKIGEQIGIITHRDESGKNEGYSFVAVQPNGLIWGRGIYGMDLSDLIDLNPEPIDIPPTKEMAIVLYALRLVLYHRALYPKDMLIMTIIMDMPITQMPDKIVLSPLS